MRDLVFVCTGNICRSPMAEYLFRDLIRASHPDWRIFSAGVAASYGVPASRHAVQVVAEKGVDLSPHRSQPLIPVMASTACLFVVMTTGHMAYLRDMYPATADKTHLLLSFKSRTQETDLLDPIGLSLDVYRYVRDEIADALVGLAAFLATVKNEEQSKSI
ncbi:MAG: low molecular weight protein arginine phosphatase [Kiritimatiellia bacterium]